MKTIQVDRRKEISPAEFRRDYLGGDGRPVVITDAAAHWPALAKWTFDYFKSAFGSDFVQVTFGGVGSNTGIKKVTNFAAYVNHLDTPEKELPGIWVSAADEKPLRDAPSVRGLPAYLMSWHAFQRHPELHQDILPHPAFIDNWVAPLDPTLRDLLETVSGKEFWSVYIGPKNTVSMPHQDFWNTHSCLTQIQGRKRAFLFSPQDSEFLYEGRVDPEQPDFGQFESFSRATAYECILEPGETLYTPPGWWHYIRALEKSITVSHNFFNDTNADFYFVNVLRKLPGLARAIGRDESLRQKLEIKWDIEKFIDKLRAP